MSGESIHTALAGAETADTVFRREQGAMVRLAVLIVGSRAEAEEAVQDAFAAMVPKWPTIEQPGAYLRTAVVNQCRQTLRRRDVERRYAEVSPPTQWYVPERLIELRDALRVLGERERCAIVLRYLIDLPDAEIAQALDCRPATVRSLIHRALAKLKKELS